VNALIRTNDREFLMSIIGQVLPNDAHVRMMYQSDGETYRLTLSHLPDIEPPLFEVFVSTDVMSGPDERKSWMTSAVVTRRKVLSNYGGYFVLLCVHRIMNNVIYPGSRNLLSRFVYRP
jgi:hypothetical protein